MNVFETIVIAIVEGLTEFLPVSSTGHMIIAQNLLGVESTDFVKAFTFIIQFGAILSVLILYWKRFFQLNRTPAPEGASAVKRFLHKYDFYWKLFIAFIPAAVFGLLFSDAIDAMLERVEVVAVTLILGGIFMIFCDKMPSMTAKFIYAIVCALITSFSIGSFFSVTYSIPSQLAEEEEKKSGIPVASMYFAIQGLFGAVAAGIAQGPLLVALKQNGWIHLLTVVVAVACMIAFVMAIFLPKHIKEQGRKDG